MRLTGIYLELVRMMSAARPFVDSASAAFADRKEGDRAKKKNKMK